MYFSGMIFKRKGDKTSEKIYVALTSIVAAVFLTVSKLIVGVVSGSLGIIAEALHSGMDLGAAIITFWAVKTSSKPPDEHHHFGHEKIENLAALFQAALLIFTCIWIGYEAIEKLMQKTHEIQHGFWTYGIMIVSIIVDSGRSRALSRTAKKYNSQALEADALHFRTDILSSLVVIVGLAGAQLGFYWTDPLAAFVVVVIVLLLSFRLGKECVDILLDRAPEDLELKIRNLLENSKENIRYKQLRIRNAGSKSFVNLVLDVNRLYTFEEVHRIKDSVQKIIEEIIPETDIMIHADPVQDEKERIIDTLYLKARQFKLNIHHILIIHLPEGYVVEFHMECPVQMPLGKAYALSGKLKEQVYNKIDRIIDINIHLEEMYYDYREGTEINGNKEMRDQIILIAGNEKKIINCHDIVFFKLDDNSISVSLDCVFSDDLPVYKVHALATYVKDEIKKQFPEISRVMVHAEPLGEVTSAK